MDPRSERIERRFEAPLLIAALLVIPSVVLDNSHFGDPWRLVGASLNWAIWVTFALELVVMLVVVPDRRGWLRRHPLEVVIVLVTPPVVPASLQFLRVLRLLRLLSVPHLGRRVFSLQGVRYAAVLAFVVGLGGGAAFSAVEKGRSAWDGVFWAIATATTGATGGLNPLTTAGRVIAIVVMLVGTGFFAVITAALAQRLLSFEIADEASAVETVVAKDIASAEADVLGELRIIMARLQELERVVERQYRAGAPQP